MIGNNPQKGLLLLDCTFVVALGSKNVTQQEVHLRALIFRVESPKPTCTYFGRGEIGLVEVSCGAIEVSDRIAERIHSQHWPGIVRGQHRVLSLGGCQLRWVPALQAAKMAAVTARRVTDLVRQGTLAGLFVKPSKGRRRVECWVDRDSLTSWIEKRDQELTRYMDQAEATHRLGLTSRTLMCIASSGLIRFVEGKEYGFLSGIYFSRQDVEGILNAFTLSVEVPVGFDHGKQIVLRDAVRLELGRNSLADLIKSIISQEVLPTGRSDSIGGILGFECRLDDIRKYRPTRAQKTVPLGFMTYASAAERLGTTIEVVRGLVTQRHLMGPKEPFSGPRIVRVDDVERFSEDYVSISSIADRMKTRSRALAKRLKQQGKEILSIQLPGKGRKLFVCGCPDDIITLLL
jgi:hypothetical protein